MKRWISSLSTPRILTGLLVFLVAFTVYVLSLQPSIPFYDCSEYAVVGWLQQVAHSPGAPLFSLLLKCFQFLPFGDIGYRSNLLSATASAATVLVLYHTLLLILSRLKGNAKPIPVDIAVSASAALLFGFTDTFWYNAVESEVYGTALLIASLILYSGLRFYFAPANAITSYRWVYLSFFFAGLAVGVHLLAVLSVFVVLLFVHLKRREIGVASLLTAVIFATVVFASLYPFAVQWLPGMLGGNLPFKNDANEYLIEGSTVVSILGILVLSLIVYLFVKGKRNESSHVASILGLLLPFLLGMSTYFQIFLRSNTEIPINEGFPRTPRALMSYLARDQYGNTPTYPRRFAGDALAQTAFEKYGEWTPPSIKRVLRKDGSEKSTVEFTDVNSAGEWNYLLKYQMGHMYFRYLLWNFWGRSSDRIDASVNVFGEGDWYRGDESMTATAVTFFGVPFFLGVFGIYFSFKRDPKVAWALLSMFLLMGVFMALQQNQQEPQSRERDYFYVGSFFVFAIWIAIAIREVASMIIQKINSKTIAQILLGTLLLALPVWVFAKNWRNHDRSHDTICRDFAHNILKTLPENSVYFTLDDNETFPLWYAQWVEGLRKDVTVVNLELSNSPAYIKQLKNFDKCGGSSLAMTFTDELLSIEDPNDARGLHAVFGDARNLEFRTSRGDTMRWHFIGLEVQKPDGSIGYKFREQDQFLYDVVRTNNFKRPIYLSSLLPADCFSGLAEHCKSVGLAYEVMAQSTPNPDVAWVDPFATKRNLLENYTLGLHNRHYDPQGRLIINHYKTLFSELHTEFASRGELKEAREVESEKYKIFLIGK